MKFIVASLVWVLWALFIGFGVLCTVKPVFGIGPSFTPLIAAVLAFVVTVARIGCRTH
jgi:ABC-type transport system involved in multi-copper enzyme maturation permease subunit